MDMDQLNDAFEKLEDERVQLRKAAKAMEGTVADSGLVELMNLMPEEASTQVFEDEMRELCLKIIDRKRVRADLKGYWKVTYIVRVPKGWDEWVEKNITVDYVEEECYANHETISCRGAFIKLGAVRH